MVYYVEFAQQPQTSNRWSLYCLSLMHNRPLYCIYRVINYSYCCSVLLYTICTWCHTVSLQSTLCFHINSTIATQTILSHAYLLYISNNINNSPNSAHDSTPYCLTHKIVCSEYTHYNQKQGFNLYFCGLPTDHQKYHLQHLPIAH